MREKTEVVFRGEWANYMHDYNVNRIREVVSFELGKEIQKDVFRLVSSVEQRKHSESPWRIEVCFMMHTLNKVKYCNQNTNCQ